MPTFTFSALKPDGAVTSGEVTAGDRAEAMRRLDRSGLQTVSLKVKDEGGGVAVVAPPKKPALPILPAHRERRGSRPSRQRKRGLFELRPKNEAALARTDGAATSEARSNSGASRS